MNQKQIGPAFCFAILLVVASFATAFPQGRPYSATTYQVRILLDRLNTRSTAFRDSLQNWTSGTRVDSTRAQDNINSYTVDFDESLGRLRDDFSRNRSTRGEAQDVLDRAARIDAVLSRRTPDVRTSRSWASLRTDLDTLASYYGATWQAYSSPGQERGPGSYSRPGGQYADRLTGTYTLDPLQSDKPDSIAFAAVRALPVNERQSVREKLARRLAAPDQIAIERQDRTVSMASSRAAEISFVADGQQQTETTPSGRTVTTRATLNGNQLMVSTQGDRNNDFTVTFDAVDGGRRLVVIRRVSDERLATPVTAKSVYARTSDVARFDVYQNNGSYGNSPQTIRVADFPVPDNAELVAVLNNDLRTSVSQNNDRFRMTVRSPREFEGAVIEGYVSGISRSGKVSGRSGLTLNFETITLRNGVARRFAGIVENVRTMNGESVRVDNEGNVQDKDSRGNTTAERAAVGTAVGAIIGAIAGGGKGAAIGAVVGAGAGAGSVYVQGRDDLDLLTGTEVTVRSSSPRER